MRKSKCSVLLNVYSTQKSYIPVVDEFKWLFCFAPHPCTQFCISTSNVSVTRALARRFYFSLHGKTKGANIWSRNTCNLIRSIQARLLDPACMRTTKWTAQRHSLFVSLTAWTDCRFDGRVLIRYDIQTESDRLVSVICLYDAHSTFLASSSDALIYSMCAFVFWLQWRVFSVHIQKYMTNHNKQRFLLCKLLKIQKKWKLTKLRKKDRQKIGIEASQYK